jgi:putative hydrolase of HD superfamily
MEKLLKCITELEKLKLVERGLNVGNRKESTAEHTWSTMLLADMLLDYIDEPLDRLKILEYILYHDVVEVYAGDAKFNNEEETKLKHGKEMASMEKIKELMPDPTRYIRLMDEYENRVNRESEYAKAIDCIDALIRNLNDDKKTKEDGFNEALIRIKYVPHVSKFVFLNELFEIIMDQLVEQGKI